MMSIEGLEKLDVWCKARDFTLAVYRQVLPTLPPEEKWGLAQQIRRSAQSIPANIAEGYGRYYYQDNVGFCYIARGSLEEALSHIVIAHDLGFISESIYEGLKQQGDDLARLVNGYIAYLKRSKQGANEPGANHVLREHEENYHVEPHEDEN